MRAKILKRILVILCILTILLPISSEVLAKIANSAAGSKQTFGISLSHQSKKLDGTAGIRFGYKIDNREAYRIYSGSDNTEGYIDTVLCLDQTGKFPKEDNTSQGEYTSLGVANASTLNQAKSSITASDAQKIQWLIRNALLPEDSEDMRNQKLDKIFASALAGTEHTENPLTVDYIKTILTEDDIVFALQCAIWKITNNTAIGSMLGTSDNGANWDGLEGNDRWGYKGRKGIFIRYITNYYNTQLEGNLNEDTSPKTNPTFDKSKATEKPTTLGAYSFLGPFKINPGTNFYSVGITFENEAGQEISVPYLLTDKVANQNVKVLAQTKEGLEGKEFYIRIRNNTPAKKVKFKLITQIQIKSAVGTVWTDGVAGHQPLLSIKRQEEPGTVIDDFYTFDIKVEKQYDASLRKYISAIKRKTMTGRWQIVSLEEGGQSRSPGNTLISATGTDPFNQYVYNHQKDPVESVKLKDGTNYDLQVGDRVVYTIRVTNECSNTMTIKRITDYLPPSGIEYVDDDTIYNSEDNKWQYSSTGRYAVTAKSSGWALDPGMYAEVQIVCEITDAAKGRVITNIAEITEIADENGKAVVDIDSEPSNINNKLPKTEKEWENYKGNEGTDPEGKSNSSYKNKDDLTDKNYYYKGQQDDDDFEKIRIKINSGEYDLQIVKVDKNDKTKRLANAQFEVTMPDGSKQTVTTNSSGIGVTNKIKITETGTDTIKVVEKKAPDGYKLLPDGCEIVVTKKVQNGNYSIDAELSGNQSGVTLTKNGNTIVITIENEEQEKEPGEYDVQIVKVEKGNVSKKLAGAKFEVTMPDGTKKTVTTGQDGTVKTDKIKVTEAGTDTIKISETEAPTGYNKIIQDIEIEVTKKLKDGVYIADVAKLKATQPEVELSASGNTITVTVQDEKIIEEEPVEYDVQLIKIDKQDSTKKLAGAKFEITMPDGTKKTIVTGQDGTIKTDKIRVTEAGKQTIKITETEAPDGYAKITETFEIEVTIETTNSQPKKFAVTSMKLKNNSDNASISKKDNTIILTIQNTKEEKKEEIYDLALKKFITSVNSANGTNKVIPEEQKRKCEVKNVDALVNRNLANPKADATYELNKTPVDVSNGDYVTYTIRVFNEGTVDATVKEIVDNVPAGLEFAKYETNSDGTYKSGSKTNYTYKWETFEDKATANGWTEGVRTKYLEDKKIPAFDKTKANGTNKELGLSYVDVKIEFKVNLDKLNETQKEEVFKKGIKNIAEITDDDGDDNDSEPDNKDPEEDDEDYDVVIPQIFDLALRKFITKINQTNVTDRVPKVTYENGNLKYNHTKEPKIVVEGQVVTYTIRVYNEGTQDGYATEITDDLPEGITFLPNHDTNKKYEWKMYDKDGNETTDVKKAVKIKTRYLSKEKSESNLLKAFDSTKPISDTNPSYKEVEAAFEVTQESATAGNKVIINTAQISEDEDKDGNEVDDIDSTPDNNEPDEDDIDKEYLVLKYFDLSLLKYVSKVIVTEDGVTKETETKYNGTENPEPVVKVELNKKKLDKTSVSYVYTIKITNEGEIEGYATEITDRIPAGLSFHEEDNTAYNWKIKEDGIVTTDYLKNTLLKPGESAFVQIVLRWERSEQNLGKKVNVAEISADDNEYDLPDIDSTPNNNKDGEDDQDSAIIVLSIQTGKATTYIVLIITIMSILASGFYLIYKKVLK